MEEENKKETEASKAENLVKDDLNKLKEANDALAHEIERNQLLRESLRSQAILGGRSLAGETAKEKSLQELADEEARRRLSAFR